MKGGGSVWVAEKCLLKFRFGFGKTQPVEQRRSPRGIRLRHPGIDFGRTVGLGLRAFQVISDREPILKMVPGANSADVGEAGMCRCEIRVELDRAEVVFFSAGESLLGPERPEMPRLQHEPVGFRVNRAAAA